ncbi:transient receptor potential channel pyrexia-like isoform X3 [Portunus trituberculatus]|uniref:transient receptor potential channel pyrexia-like isoform X3 n=1 Tax=Portunus trituberculatus TaxID=210409 RepID=UPI001E1CDF98|nr:transient receptor potential channel pyrexia-like isoform X3 [Portunus trituberculatus]
MMFVREGFQLKCRRIHYFKNFNNILDLLLPAMVLVLIFTPENFSGQFAAWVIIAAWLQVMLTVGRAPYFTLYIKMLSCVFMNYLTLMPLFIFLITGFTLSLALTNQHYYEKKHENENRSFWEMFPKTISMSMGELDYSSLSKEFPTSVMARISAVFVFFAFVFGIIMVTMNVMNGLAVISTKEVKDEAELYKLISQLELIFMAEAFIQMCPRLGSFLGNTQFLSRSHNASCLLACINKDPKELILCTKEQEKGTRERLTKLDNDTADSLRCEPPCTSGCCTSRKRRQASASRKRSG